MNANEQTPTAKVTTKHSFRLRFSLRSLLLVTALVSIACWAIPASIRWHERRELRKHIELATSMFQSDPISYTNYAIPFQGKQYYISHNGLIYDGKINLFSNQEKPLDITSEALFVSPPNIWVTSTKEAMAAIVKDRSNGEVEGGLGEVFSGNAEYNSRPDSP